MTATSEVMTAGEHRDTIQTTECQLCFDDLNKKRTLTIGCGHTLHRTCLVRIVETSTQMTEDNSVRCCPVCSQSFDKDVVDEKQQRILPLVTFGPTGHPSFVLVKALENPASNFTKNMTNIDNVTRHWLKQVAQDLLDAANTDGKSEEYIQDIVDEEHKLNKRLRIIAEMQNEYENCKMRIVAAVQQRTGLTDAIAMMQMMGADSKALGLASKLQARPMQTPIVEARAPYNIDDCPICQDSLSTKRSVVLQCAHAYHQTCCMTWFEASLQHKCSLCQAMVQHVVDEDGLEVDRTYPFEKNELLIVQRPAKVNIYYVTSYENKLIELLAHLTKQRRRALKEKRDKEYITDIDEEMEKLRLRYSSLLKIHQAIAEERAVERIVHHYNDAAIFYAYRSAQQPAAPATFGFLAFNRMAPAAAHAVAGSADQTTEGTTRRRADEDTVSEAATTPKRINN